VAGRAARRLGSWLAASALVAGCGGAPARRPAPAASAPRELLPEDQALTASPLDVAGVAYGPDALGLPVMPRVRTRGSLEQARKAVARPRPAPADVHALVTLLWSESARLAPADPTRAAALRTEARAALRAERARARAATDPTTLQMLAVAESWLGDEAAASAALEELLARRPPIASPAPVRLALVASYLRQHRVVDASRVTAAWQPAALEPAAAYALAWVALESGDAARARQAIARAASTWPDESTGAVVDRDLLLVLARTRTEPREAIRITAEAAGADADRRYQRVFALSDAYRDAGDYEAAAVTLELLLTDGSRQAPPDDQVGFRYRQADYAFRQGRPAEAAARAIEAAAALGPCRAACPPATHQAVADRILKLAQFSHTVYARSQDGAHYDAAVTLYQRYAALPDRSDADAARGFLASLRETKASADPAAGKHDAEVLSNYLAARREVLAACYEAALAVQPALDGSLRLTLEIAADGAVRGATSEPAAGAEGIPLVAACAIERVRGWRFPARALPGTTTLIAPVELRRRAADPAAP
jgi:tetratricopeptide (TPR) repeat protein